MASANFCWSIVASRAFIIAVIRNGMNLMGVGAPEQLMVLGSVLLLSVTIDMQKRKGTAT